MNTASLPALFAVLLCRWLLARFGLEFTPVAAGSATTLFYRDKRGRFVSLDRCPPTRTWGPLPVGEGDSPNRARPGETQWSPEQQYGLPETVPEPVAELMHDIGITPRMYETAHVPLVLPEDLDDVPALERALRHWILRNMDHWVNGRGVFSVMQALMRTYAITLYLYKPPRKMRQATRGLASQSLEEQYVGKGLAPLATAEGFTTKNTKDTKFEEADSTSEPSPHLCDLGVLRGESSRLDTSTTAGGDELRPYEHPASCKGYAAGSQRPPPLKETFLQTTRPPPLHPRHIENLLRT